MQYRDSSRAAAIVGAFILLGIDPETATAPRAVDGPGAPWPRGYAFLTLLA
jgi:hypothetical protein